MFGFGPILTLVDSIAGGGGFVPYSPRYLGSNVTVTGSVAIPSGATSLTITLENAGGGGAKSFSYGSAYGGSGGARCVKTIAIDPADAAKVINYSLGAKGIGRKGSVGNGTDSGACSVSAPVALVAGAIAMATTAAGGGKLTGTGAQSTASGGTATSGAVGDITKGGNSGSGALGGTTPSPGQVGGGGGCPGWRADSGDGPFGGIGFSMSWDGADGGVARVTFAFT